jgi:tripartite ATP-independent transporter DctM subunit
LNEAALYGLIYVGALIGLSLLGLHVAMAIGMTALGGAWLLLGMPGVKNIGNLAWNTANDYLLVSIPLFILLGELLLRAGFSDRMYKALAAWLSRVPGGLLHTNIIASALFAATSGSSIATAATIGTIALPAFEERKYNESLVLGSICAGGTLGILIPPSINMIVYASLTNTSIGQLFVAGIVPGLILTVLFMMVVAVGVSVFPSLDGKRPSAMTLGARLRGSLNLLPPFGIFGVVMGSIYGGFATATEAAALGVVAAACLAAWRRQLTIEVLNASFRSTVRISGMVMLIIVAAYFLNFVLSLAGLPQAIAKSIVDLGASPIATIWILVGVYVVLGMFLEVFAMMIATIPIVAPIVFALGFDPIWFGVFIVLMCELALITPPVGMNLYVVQAIRPRGGSITTVMAGSTPFLIALFVMTAMLIHFPQIALWLPNVAFK